MSAVSPGKGYYEAIIKVDRGDPPERRARDIVEGLSYAVVILIAEYGFTIDRIYDVLQEVEGAAQDAWDRLHPFEDDDE